VLDRTVSNTSTASSNSSTSGSGSVVASTDDTAPPAVNLLLGDMGVSNPHAVASGLPTRQELDESPSSVISSGSVESTAADEQAVSAITTATVAPSHHMSSALSISSYHSQMPTVSSSLHSLPSKLTTAATSQSKIQRPAAGVAWTVSSSSSSSSSSTSMDMKTAPTRVRGSKTPTPPVSNSPSPSFGPQVQWLFRCCVDLLLYVWTTLQHIATRVSIYCSCSCSSS
jgi:hypothetical protein